MEYKDYYKTLGVPKTATQDEIKKAFRKLAVKHHPDKNPGDKKAEERFKEANEANEVLSDPEKRKKYDELGANWKAYQQQGGNDSTFDWERYANRQRQGRTRQYTNEEDPYGESHFSDFFESIFGGGFEEMRSGGRSARSRGPTRGQDVEATMEISLEDAYHGSTKQVVVDGQRINMKLQPGIREGQLFRMKGKGGEGHSGGQAGDLIITVHLANHPRYKVKELDIHFEESLDMFTAVLGGKANVSVFEKTVKVDIPAGTDSGKIFRLRGLGMPTFGKPETRGDAYVKMMITVPKNLSASEKAAFSELSKEVGDEKTK